MRNGSGDDYFILFTPAGAAIKGYAHECPMQWTKGPVQLPDGDDPDGSKFLLELLTGDPRGYQTYAKDYFEADVPLASIESIYAHEVLTPELVQSINANVKIADLRDDLAEIGYPTDS